MRRIKHTVFLILALLPLAAYLFAVFRSGTVPGFLTTVETAFGDFGGFFEPLITPLLSELVELTDTTGVAVFAWIIGYYVVLILVYLVFSLFTFLITIFMDKVDRIGGNRR